MDKLLSPNDFRRVAWANGCGFTTELLRSDTISGGVLYRLSIADVTEPGPFSPLPGIDRTLMLLDGAGFELSIDGTEQTIAPLEPIHFSGDAATFATRVAGPSRDFNVMTARGKARAETAVLHTSALLPRAEINAVYVVSGGFRVDGQLVPQHHLGLWHGKGTRPLNLGPQNLGPLNVGQVDSGDVAIVVTIALL